MIGLNKINQTMITGGAIGANPRGPSDQQSKTAGHGKRGKQSFPLNLRKEFGENHIKMLKTLADDFTFLQEVRF